jgi:hypothetical protein
MIAVRDQLRQVLLSSAGFEFNPVVEPQWLALSIFFVLFVSAILVVAWMVRVLLIGNPDTPEH